MDHNAINRFGSARWAELHDLKRGRLLGGNGLYLGSWQGRALRIESDAPMLTIAGSGAGKLATVIAYTACCGEGTTVILDPKGEIAAISLDAQVQLGKAAFLFDPLGLLGRAQHRVNPLGFLKPNALSLTADIKMICEDLIVASRGESQFFEDSARAWMEAFFKFDVLAYGTASLARVLAALQIMTADGEEWKSLASLMSGYSPQIADTITKIMALQEKSERTFVNVVAEINRALAWTSDPALLACLSEDAELDLEAFVAGPPANFYLVVPPEIMGVWSPFLRLLFGALSIIKGRLPQARRLNLIVDEAGQLGKAEFLPRAFTFGRGVGIKTWAFFQDIGQISRAYGREGVQTFMNSAEIRQFFGIRDYETARLISDMAGAQTLAYVDPLQREQAIAARKRAAWRFMQGHDRTAAVIEAVHYRKAASEVKKQHRALIDPAEVMALPRGQQIIFNSGQCPPILAEGRPYFEDRGMAGRFFPNPFHPPADRVRVPGRFGMRWRRIVEEKVPPRFAHLPQYQDGTWRYVEGYRPR